MMSTKRKAESLRPCIMKCGGSQVDSERDSGFSDASSEHQSTMDTTDSEDSPQPRGQKGATGAGSGPKPSQLAVVGGSYSGLSPMIIMNNVVLKQPVENPPSLKPWGFSPAVEVVQPVVPQSQVVFLQPVVSRQASPSSKEAASKHRRSKKYFPILKSYPKIAPHPGDSSASSGRGTASSSSSSSFSTTSSSSGSEKCSSLTSNLWEQCPREKVQRSLCSSTSNSRAASPSLPGTPSTPSTMSPLLQSRLSLPAAETSSGVTPATERPSSAADTPPFGHSTNQALTLDSISSLECNESDGNPDTKRKRFCNTYNILSKSGLLDITLRTKELLRQNQSTQNELDRLKKHTDLFFQALQSGDTSICMKLLTSLREEDRDRAAQL
ncbi:CLOCK-interacting pacemaker-like [Xiphophorus maculatus]|uniref:CLOCK-interacting pacemaker b n=1 Tax=Xiphophorus maculatus TaxID=8083 RepID=A0A3B5PRI6_XIPMA|nr:CLOCK-interacting pacemaker-like [Xiphophorus maculatus]